MKTPGIRVLIAASGTGGHLCAGLWVGQAFQKLAPTNRSNPITVEFVGSGRPLEGKILDPAGFKRHVIDIVGVKGRGVRGALQFVLKLPRAFAQSWQLISTFEPSIVIGVGGYVTVLPIFMAWLRGVPTWIHEAELKPGLANLALALFATKVSLGFREAKLPWFARTIYTGHPIRPELITLAQKKNWPSEPRRLLVMGGSQGARSLDQAVPALALTLKQLGISVKHQCRSENVNDVMAAYVRAGIEAEVVSFIEDTPAAYGWAELVIARSGAGTTMEIGVVGLPAILVPYPFAQGGHQLANAQTLDRKGQAVIVEEGEDFVDRLKVALLKAVQPENYGRLTQAGKVERETDGAKNIACGAIGLIEQR